MTVSDLTGRLIRSAKTKKSQYTIWDRKSKGFGLRVTPLGHKSFVINFTKDGTRHTETIGDATTMSLRDARALAKKRIKILTAQHDVGFDTPFEVIAEVVIRRHARLWKPSTMAVNRGYLKNTILPFFSGRPIGGITKEDVEYWFAGLRSKPATANRSAPVLSVIMNEAEEMNARPENSNPVLGLRRYRRPKKQRVLTPDEWARLGAALEKLKKKYPREVSFFLLLILTGCRKGELKNLRWLDYRDGSLHLLDSKTGPKEIILCSHARRVLDELKTKRSGLVFPPKRKGVRGSWIDEFWWELRREIGLDDVRVHDLRHSYASVAIRLKINLIVIGLLLGHNDTESTQRYAHLDDQMMRDAMQLADEDETKNGDDENED
jgi:integrase